MKTAAIYARVSTADQADTGTSLATQVENCRRWCAQHGYSVFMDIEEDASGATLARPGLDKVRDWASQPMVSGEERAVVFYKLDRLSRDTGDTLLLLKELRAAGVAVESATVKIEDSPEGQFLLTMLAAAASFERAQILERTRRGKERRAKDGRVVGGPMRPFGYRFVVGEGRYEIVPEEAEWVKRIFSWCIQDQMSAHAIALRLTACGVATVKLKTRWSDSSVLSMLRNEVYAGVWYFGKYTTTSKPGGKRAKAIRPREQWIPVSVPAIVTMDEIRAAGLQVRNNLSRSKRNAKCFYLLRGALVRCSLCGGAMTGEKASGRTHTSRDGSRRGPTPFLYRCVGSKSRTYRAPEDRCPNSYIHGPTLEEAIWRVVCEQLGEPRVIETMLADLQSQELARDEHTQSVIAGMEVQKHKLVREAEQLLDLHLAGEIDRPMFSRRMREVRDREKALALEQASWERKEGSGEAVVRHLREMKDVASKIGEGLPLVSPEDRRAFLLEYNLHLRTDGDWLVVDGLVRPARVKLERLRPNAPRKGLRATKAA